MSDFFPTFPRIDQDYRALMANLQSKLDSSRETRTADQAATTAFERFLDLSGSFNTHVKDIEKEFKNLQARLSTAVGNRFPSKNTNDLTDNVRIGTVLPTVPPTSISVEEAKGSEVVHGLRNRGIYQIKTGRGSIRIRMELVFPTIDLVNNELRHIIGQFSSGPILPLESRYIYDLVHGSESPPRGGDDDKPGKAGTRVAEKVKAEVTKANAELVEVIRTIVNAINDHKASITEIDDRNEATSLVEAAENKTSITEMAAAFRRAIRFVFRLSTKNLKGDYENEAEANLALIRWEAQIQRLEDLSHQRDTAVAKLTGEEISRLHKERALPIVPVILENLSLATMPGNPEGVMVELTVQFFNHFPYMDRFLYRDAFNSWTPDITRCVLWDRYYTKRMADLGIDVYRPRADIIIQYPYAVDQSFEPEVNPPTKEKGKTKYEKLTFPYRADPRVDQNSFYIDSFAVSMTNLLSPQYVVSANYPTFQYMGALPVQASMRILVRHDEVGKIHRIKKMIDLQGVKFGDKVDRKNYLSFSGGCLPGVLGYQKFQVELVSTAVVDTEWSAVTFQMTGFQEPKDPTFFHDYKKSNRNTRERLKEGLKIITRMADLYAAQVEVLQAKYKLSYGKLSVEQRLRDLEDGVLELRDKKQLEFRAWEILFGSSKESSAGFFSVPALQGFLLTSGGATLLQRIQDTSTTANKLFSKSVISIDKVSEEQIDKAIAESKRFNFFNDGLTREEARASIIAKRRSVGSADIVEARIGAEDIAAGIIFALRAQHGLSTKLDRNSVDEFFSNNRHISLAKELLSSDISLEQELLKFKDEYFNFLFPENVEEWRDLNHLSELARLSLPLLGGGSPENELFAEHVEAQIQKLDDKGDRGLRRPVLYPDLGLPTYDQLYKDFVYILEDKLGMFELSQEVTGAGRPKPAGPTLTSDSTTGLTLRAVVDGDTIKVIYNSNLESIRMLRINTPEVGQPGYQDAKDHLASLLPAIGQPVNIEFETTEERDTYGRLLAYVFNPSNGENANLEMVRDGYSPFFTEFGEGKYSDDFKAAQATAIAANAGLWGTGEIFIPTQRFIRVDKREKGEWSNLPGVEELFGGIPREGDLGRLVRLEQVDQLAVKGTDVVDPDFYFYWSRQKKTYEDVANKYVRGFLHDMGDGGNFPVVTPEQMTKSLETGLNAVKNKKAKPKETQGKRLEVKGWDPKEGKVALSDNPGQIKSQLLDYNPAAADQIMSSFDASMASIRDDRTRMVRFFPTFQLFFINEEDGIFYKVSDFYGYHSVLSIDVTRHKWQPDVLDIKIANPVGPLEGSRFRRTDSIEQKVDDSGINNPLKGSFTDARLTVDRSDKKLTEKLLKEGTRISLKMGYGSDPANLETVFNGKIAELMIADIVHIVAQGFGSELAFPMGEKEIDMAGFTTTLGRVVGFTSSRPHKALTLAHGVMSDSTVEHFGDWGLGHDIMNLIEIGAVPESIGSDTETSKGGIMQAFHSRFFRTLSIDPRLENVGGFITPTLETRFDSFERADLLLGKSSWQLKPDMTGLQVFREMTMMYPNHVFSVVNYDDRASLYIGPVDGYYFHTEEGRRERVKASHQIQTKKRESLVPHINRLVASWLESRLGQVAVEEAAGSPPDIKDRLKKNPEIVTKALLRVTNNDSQAAADIGSTFVAFFLPEPKDRTLAVEQFVEARIPLVGPGKATMAAKILGLQGAALKEVSVLWDESQPEDVSSDFFEMRDESRVLFYRFLEYIRLPGGKGILDAGLRDALADLRAQRDVNKELFYQGARPLREYHFVDSFHDIIDNQIVATRGVMKNVVRMFGGDSDNPLSSTAVMDDDLDLGEQLIGHAYILNADSQVERYRASYGALAEMFRPMYRGSLIIRGNPHIKPYDVVFIYDVHNKIWGPIEVERVVHSYSHQFGFITTITPNVVCTCTDTVSWAKTTGMSILYGIGGVTAVAAGTFLAVAAVAAAPIAIVAGVAIAGGMILKSGADVLFQNTTGATMFGTLTGKGWVGRDPTPIAFTPLIHDGEPFVAGLNGFDRADAWHAGELIGKKINWAKRGFTRKVNEINQAMRAMITGQI